MTTALAPIAVASLAALVGLFAVADSGPGDRRAALAGLRPGALLSARVGLISFSAAMAVAVSLGATAVVFDLRRKGAGDVPVQDPRQLEEWLRENLSNNDPGPYYPEIMRTGLALLVQSKMTPVEQDRYQTWILLDQLSEASAAAVGRVLPKIAPHRKICVTIGRKRTSVVKRRTSHSVIVSPTR